MACTIEILGREWELIPARVVNNPSVFFFPPNVSTIDFLSEPNLSWLINLLFTLDSKPLLREIVLYIYIYIQFVTDRVSK